MITGHKVEMCPFCRATQAYLHIRKGSAVQVRCGRCGAEGPEAKSESEAVEKWNKNDGMSGSKDGNRKDDE